MSKSLIIKNNLWIIVALEYKKACIQNFEKRQKLIILRTLPL